VARTILATLPGSGPSQRLEVSVEQRAGGSLAIHLDEQHYAEGIGWFTQRSMSLDPRQWSALRDALGAGQTNLGGFRLDAIEAEPPATIPFPGPAPTDRRLKRAVGHSD